MKKSFITFILFLYTAIAFTQQAKDVSSKINMDGDMVSPISNDQFYKDRFSYLSTLDKSLISTGILIDRTKFRKDINLFNGDNLVKTCSNYIWQQLYENLKSASLDTSTLPRIESIRDYLVSMGRFQNTFILPILNMQFNSIDEKALKRGDFMELNGSLYSNVASNNSFHTNRLLASAPFATRIHGNSITFLIDKNLYFSNISNEIVKIVEADFDDGKGWQIIEWGIPVTITYGSKSRWIMPKLKITLQQELSSISKIGKETKSINIIQRYAHFNFLHTTDDLVPQPNLLNKTNQLKDYVIGPYAGSNTPTTNILHYGGTISRNRSIKWVVGNSTRSLSWTETNGAKFDYNILLGQGNISGKLRKPIIIVDGFDPENKRDYYQTVIPNPTGDIKSDDYRGLYEIMSGVKSAWTENPADKGANLCSDLIASGYDLIFINWTNGDGDITSNAGFLQEFLTDMVNGPNSPNYRDNQTEEIILIGPSMGGLITRYCLTNMELLGLEHHVKQWYSFDSPQQGAYIPISLQWQVKYLSDLQNNKTLQDGINSLNSTAAKQMLLYHYQYFNGTSTQTPNHVKEFDNLYNYLNNLKNPYPLFCKNIAISNGGTQKLYSDANGDQICNFRTDMKLIDAIKSKANINVQGGCNEIIKYGIYSLNPVIAAAGLTCDIAINNITLKFSTRGYRSTNFGVNKMFWGSSANGSNIGLATNDDYTFYTYNQIGFENAPGGYNTSLYDFNQTSLNDFKPSTDLTTSPQTSKSCFMVTSSAFGVPVTSQNVYKTWNQYNVSETPFDAIYGTSNTSNEEHVRVSTATSNWLQNIEIVNDRVNVQKPFHANANQTERANCLYTATNSVTFGGLSNSSFTIKSGANVQAIAPTVKLLPGFTSINGSQVVIKASSVVNGLKSDMIKPISTQLKSAISYLTPSEYNNKVYDYSDQELITDDLKTEKNRTIMIYPNPANKELYISCSDSTCKNNVTIKVNNLLGECVKLITIDLQMSNIMDISDLPIGIYLVHVICNDKQFSYKLLKK